MKLRDEIEFSLNNNEWLVKLPLEWDSKRLKYVGKVRPSNVDKKTEENEKSVSLCNYNEVYKNDFINSSLDFMEATATLEEISKFQIQQDDVIITKDSETPDEIALPAYVVEYLANTLCGYHLSLIRSNKSVLLGTYLFRLFQSKQFNAQFTVAANGITRFGLDTYSIKNAVVSLPTLPEQLTIAKFLDYKTAQIDSLIEKKEELLKLLEEKRIALITNAVTGKLTCHSEEPDSSGDEESNTLKTTRMKSSGIPWLGEIPEDWEVKRLKYVAQVRFSGVDKKTIEGENDVLLCNYVDVYKNDFIDNKIEFMKATATDNEIERFTIKKDDVIATKDSETPYEIALPALVNQEFENVVCGYHLALIRANNKYVTGEFLFRLFQASNFNSQFIVQANGITRFGLGVDAFTTAMVPIPSIEEQKNIVRFISIELDKIDTLSSKVAEAIEKLKEYRTSLITSAVTGKIDLRNWQHPATDAQGVN